MKKVKRIDSDVKPKARVNYSIDESNFVKKDKPIIPRKLHNTSTFENKAMDKSQSSNLDETVVYEESCKSPDISNICGEFFSPKSQREPVKVYLNQTSIKSQNIIEESQHNLTTNNNINLNIEKLLDITSINNTTYENVFDIEKTNDFLRKIKKKKQEMIEKEKKLLKEQEDLRIIKESIIRF